MSTVIIGGGGDGKNAAPAPGTTRACSNCANAGTAQVIDRMKSGQPVDKTVCRRYPPQPLLNGNGMAEAVWPVVKPDDWCGDWTAPFVASDPKPKKKSA